MTRTLPYGTDKVLSINPPADTVVFDFAESRVHPLEDPGQAVAAALAQPLEYPNLAQATVPGDRVAVAVAKGVPRLDAILPAVIETLLDAGIAAKDLTVLLTEPDFNRGSRAIQAGLPARVAALVNRVQHDPADQESLSYLAASKENKAIYVNRHAYDADVVLPISCARPHGALGYFGQHGALFPTFSDQAMQERFRAPDSVTSPVHQRRRQDEVNEAAWLLGAQLAVQIVPGPGDTVLHVIAGETRAVAQRCGELCDEAWLHRVPQPAALVVAAVGGRREQQTWENVARALSVAMAVAEDNGAIVLCTDIRSRPGEALQRLIALDEESQMLRKIRRARSPDAVAAWLLVQAMQRGQVYLLSNLEEDTVEDLGLGYVSSAAEVDRLAQRCDSCILLADAHRAQIELESVQPEAS
jgi:nickel-dependent lactate racemase